MRWKVTVIQATGDEQLHSEDVNVAGEYLITAGDKGGALDLFHLTVPIKVLDCFHIEVEPDDTREESIGVGGWEQKAAFHLVGKTISAVRYMTADEAEGVGFTRRPLLIVFNDASYIYASMDDEGNDAGALFTSFKNLQTIPVIS